VFVERRFLAWQILFVVDVIGGAAERQKCVNVTQIANPPLTGVCGLLQGK
jgi:hypothetical protein